MIVLIIGGVAGGATAAARLRRLDEKAEIIIVERTGYISYANCGLPYYIGGEIDDAKDLTLQTPESFRRRFRIDVRVNEEAVAIDSEAKTVTIQDLATKQTYLETYDVLLLSPGARPTRPALRGLDDPRVFCLRTVEDTLAIANYIREQEPKTAVIVGGGYIGLEMAENLCRKGLAVTILQKPDQLLTNLDYDMACHVLAYLREKGVSVHLGSEVASFADSGLKLRAITANGDAFDSELVIFAAGIRPDTALARSAGLELSENGAIIVDEHMRTSKADIYAVGDAVEIVQLISGQRTAIALAGPANKQARIAADHICGIPSSYRGATGAAITRVFDLTVASVGLNETAAAKAGIDWDQVILRPASHATYYPGATALTMKVIFQKSTGKLLGAQIIGFDGVDKRIDVLACAIAANMTAAGLTAVDLAYAPPYGTAKDPVNMAGCVMENVLTAKVRQFYWCDVAALPRDNSVALVDVRTKREYEQGHIDGFVNIPLDGLRERLSSLPKQRPVYVLCETGLRSYLACRILSQNGYDCFNLAGGYSFWETVMRAAPPNCAPPAPCGAKK